MSRSTKDETLTVAGRMARHREAVALAAAAPLVNDWKEVRSQYGETREESKARRRREAVRRQDLRDVRSAREQLAGLAMMGHQYCKESVRLKELIAASEPVVESPHDC